MTHNYSKTSCFTAKGADSLANTVRKNNIIQYSSTVCRDDEG